MIKKIIKLSQIFISDYLQKIEIFNKQSKKLNKQSLFTWLILILFTTISILSINIINWLNVRGLATIFFKIYFPIMATFFMFQGILTGINVFFFSKDTDYILPMPIKPIELLIAKFNTVLFVIYAIEVTFLLIPLIIYGIILVESIFYFLNIFLVLIIFPIFYIAITSLIIMFVMKLNKYIKNKEIFQIIIIILLSLILGFAEGAVLNSIFGNGTNSMPVSTEVLNNKLNQLNDYFVIINPCIDILNNNNKLNIIQQFIKIILICMSSFLVFIIIGKKIYLKNLLKNNTSLIKNKKNNKIIKNKYKEKTIKNAYIKNEFKKLIKNSTIFIHCIFQYIFIVAVILIIINLCIPMILASINEMNPIKEMGKDKFSIQTISIILVIIQIIFTLCNISITAISREGKSAQYMKYIPINLYKQFLWKSMPQIFVNIFVIFLINIIIYINIPRISIIYYIIITLIGMLINILNSFLMLIIDLRKPSLEWTTEMSAIKNQKNKLYQYAISIIIIMIIIYLTKILENTTVFIFLSTMIFIFSIIILVLNLYVKKNIKKLFNKIY